MRKSRKATWRVMVTTWCDRLIQEEVGDQAGDDSMSDNDKAEKLGRIRFPRPFSDHRHLRNCFERSIFRMFLFRTLLLLKRH